MRPIIVFDLDGTLADTAPDLMATLNVLLENEGLPTLPTEKANSMIGAGARALLARGFEAAGLELTPQKHEDLFQAFLAHYGENLCVETQLFPGVVEALDALEQDGYSFAVCTNKMVGLSVRLLEQLDIAQRFEAICGRDSFPWYKPDPRHLTMTIEQAVGDKSRAIMIGDSLTDIATARAAEIPVIAVPFGYTDRPVSELGPDRIIEHFEELPDAVRAVFASHAA